MEHKIVKFFIVVLLVFFIAGPDYGLSKENKSRDFIESTNIKELISGLKFQVDPVKYSIIIFGIQTKQKGEKFQLKALARSFAITKGLFGVYYYVGKEDMIFEEGLYKYAHSGDLTLYVFFANTSQQIKKLFPSEEWEFLPEAFSEIRFGGFMFEDMRIDFIVKKGDTRERATFGYPIKPGFIYFIGNFFIDISRGESPMKLPEKPKEAPQYIREYFPPIKGFRFESE